MRDISGWETAEDEPLGTKPKMWVRDPTDPHLRWLWKEATLQDDAQRGRFAKGDDWAEVVASRLGRSLGIPVAEVHLAQSGSTSGIVSRSVLRGGEVLVHGNELLAERGRGTDDPRDRTGYTVAATATALEGVGAPHGSSADLPAAFEWFAGYLVLDALIGNTDRHQDNWGVVRGGGPPRLAPSFDHASSLGFLLSDEEREERLGTNDRNRSVASFAGRASSKFEGRPTLVAAAIDALMRCPAGAVEHWDEVVRTAPRLDRLFADLPSARVSSAARSFAAAVYEHNRRSLSEALRTMGA